MRRFCLLLIFLLTACQVTSPVIPTPTPAEATNIISSVDTSSELSIAPTWTPQPTLTPTPEPTTTLTPQPTLTPAPTITPTSGPTADPVVLIARPVAHEFVPGSISVAGKVANVTNGTVLLALRSPDGQSIGPESVVATTAVVSDGLSFAGEIVFELPPTPRPFTVHVGWTTDGQTIVAESSQSVNLLGRYPRVDRLTMEVPQPFNRGVEPTFVVRGVAPGPPVKVLVRLLDGTEQVLESVEARMRWNQPGLPCAFDAVVPNNLAATQMQVIMLGPDDAVLEAKLVRLASSS